MPRSPNCRYAAIVAPRGSPQARFAPLLKNVGTPWRGAGGALPPTQNPALCSPYGLRRARVIGRLPPALR